MPIKLFYWIFASFAVFCVISKEFHIEDIGARRRFHDGNDNSLGRNGITTSSKRSTQRMAYHLLHPNEGMPFLPRILEEIPHYPVETHLFIHSFKDVTISLPDTWRGNVEIVQHVYNSSLLLSRGLGLDRSQPFVSSRADLLVVTPSFREQLIRVGRRFDYSMYSEDDVFVRRETVALWMNRAPAAFAKNMTISFIRLECTLALCRAIDYSDIFPATTRHYTTSRDGQVSYAQTTIVSSGVWILPHRQMILLDRSHPGFLRHDPNNPYGLDPRGSIGIGGADAYHLHLFAMRKSWLAYVFDPDTTVLHHGAQKWHLGVWFCKLLRGYSKCLHPPDEYFAAIPSVVVSPSSTQVQVPLPMSVSVQAQLVKGLVPLSVKICAVSTVQVNHSKLHHIGTPVMSLHRGRSVKIGYGPWLTKAGSSSAVIMLKDVTMSPSVKNVMEAEHHNISNNRSDMSVMSLSQQILDEYTFISFIRNPMDRALAGYHQMETFFHMNWLGRYINMHQLQWWNYHCLDANFGVHITNEHTCTGSVPDNSQATVLKRFIGYLEEVERIGFYDQHQTPMTYLMATSSVLASPRSFFFDIKSMFTVSEVISQLTGLKASNTVEHSRSVVNQADIPWSFTWADLLLVQNNKIEAPEVASLAAKAIYLMCSLYKVDVDCLPYKIPECGPVLSILT